MRGATSTRRATTAASHVSGRLWQRICRERSTEARQAVGSSCSLDATALHAASRHSAPACARVCMYVCACVRVCVRVYVCVQLLSAFVSAFVLVRACVCV